jgi:hypothetical protein
MSERTVPQFVIIAPERITPEEFATLKDVSHLAGEADRVCARLPAYTWGKALLTTRRLYQSSYRTSWHIVERQYQFGQPVYFARPIVIRLSAEAMA